MGEKPDNLYQLELRLKQHPLDNGSFAYKKNKLYYFRGNFITISAVFNIVTDEKEVYQKFRKLIRQNQKTESHKNQEKEIK